MNKQLIERYYHLSVLKLTLLDSHFGTDIYLLDAEEGK